MGRSDGPNGPPPASRSARWSDSSSFTPTSEPNSPINMFPLTNAPRLPNIGLTSTRSSAGTNLSNRALSASDGFGIFIGNRSKHHTPRVKLPAAQSHGQFGRTADPRQP